MSAERMIAASQAIKRAIDEAVSVSDNPRVLDGPYWNIRTGAAADALARELTAWLLARGNGVLPTPADAIAAASSFCADIVMPFVVTNLREIEIRRASGEVKH